jgi:hypothetical protein
MAIIIAAKTDPFEERFNQRAARARTLGMANMPMDFSHVRRPLRGMVIKPDTFATLEVFESDGTPVPLINASSRTAQEQIEALMRESLLKTDVESMRSDGASTTDMRSAISESFRAGATTETLYPSEKLTGLVAGYKTTLQPKAGQAVDGNRANFLAGRAYSLRYANFLISGVQESRQEKYQLMETFGVPYIFFFGERPRVYQYSGVLLNSLDFQWRNEFWANYDEVLRGTRLVDRNARVVLTIDDVVVEGYILQASATEDSQTKELVQFNFQLFVTNYTSLANLGDPTFPVPAAVQIDTSYWMMNNLFEQNKQDVYKSNVDIMRRSNLDELAKRELAANSPTGFMGNVARALATAGSVLSQASAAVSSVVSRVSRFINGRDVRFPVGAFPLLDEIQTSPVLLSRVESGQSIGGLVSSNTRKLVEGFATDSAGRPSFFVQDKDLIIDLTKRYNQQASRRVKILPAIPAFVSPTNPRNIGGRISDNVDEYIQSFMVGTYPGEVHSEESIPEDRTELELNEVIDEMAAQLKKSGMLISKAEMTALEIERTARATGVLQLGVMAGSFGLSVLTAPAPPPPPSAPYKEPPKGVQVEAYQDASTESEPASDVRGRRSGLVKVNKEEVTEVYEEDVNGQIVTKGTQKTKVLKAARVERTDTYTPTIQTSQDAATADASSVRRWMAEGKATQSIAR